MHIEYPDEVVFVFNPLYIGLTLEPIQDAYKFSYLKFSISTGSNNSGTSKIIEAYLYKGKTRLYMSKIMELFFTDARFERSKTLFANIIVSGKVVWSVSFICIWGNLAVGDRFAHYGAFKLDKNRPYFERKRIWFRNFPFTVSLFAHGWGSKDRGVSARYDGKAYDKSLYIHYPPIWGVINSIEDEDIYGPYDDVVGDGNSSKVLSLTSRNSASTALLTTIHSIGTGLPAALCRDRRNTTSTVRREPIEYGRCNPDAWFVTTLALVNS